MVFTAEAALSPSRFASSLALHCESHTIPSCPTAHPYPSTMAPHVGMIADSDCRFRHGFHAISDIHLVNLHVPPRTALGCVRGYQARIQESTSFMQL
mmetsp:Transcript_97707/g.203898  ORF Transcript_97707/g.203898 Transcript_97707/m.203898 type:complete len:97 (+) Transcript_97707:852-1142(+)